LVKSTYSEEEVSEILDNLIQERKRAQDLEIELERIQKEAAFRDPVEATGDQTQKYKQLIAVLRKKYEEAQKRIEQFTLEQDRQKSFAGECEGLSAELKESQNRLAETTQNLKESEDELDALREQLVKLKETIHATGNDDLKTKEELESSKQKQAQLERVIQFLRQRSEEAHLENHELVQEVQKVQAAMKELHSQLEAVQSREKHFLNQNEQLKEQCALAQGELHKLKETSQGSRATLETLERDKALAEKHLSEQKEELEFIKQMMMKALQEAKEERAKSEERYLQRIGELETQSAAISQSQAKEASIFKEKLRTVESERDHALETAREKYAVDLEEWRKKQAEQLKETESLKQAFVRKQEELEQLQNETAHLAKAQADLEDQLHKTEGGRDEAESRLKVAQQHLAKKVRETTLLSEKNEELRLQHLELQNALEVSKAKLIELQSNLEMEGQHQRRLHEQYQEGIKSFEGQALKWEEKYFQMHEKWQEAENRIREFKRLEERYFKIQQLLNQLGGILGTPLALPNPQEFPPEQIEPPQRYRETLFE